MGTNIYIQSDFIEDYDKYLHDPMGEIRWKRLSRGGRNRREIFKLLYQYIKSTQPLRVNVAPNGTVKELYDRYDDNYEGTLKGEKWNSNWDHTGICSPFSELVIYKDEMAHRGEGKEVMLVEDALRECPDFYASVLLRNNQDFSISYRLLYIGDIEYKLTYISLTDSWRSNCGHVVILYNGHKSIPLALKAAKEKEGTVIKSPIFAFDYVEIPVACSQYPYGSPEKFFVDFNEAPGIPEEVVVNEWNHPMKGDLVSFSEIVSFKDIAVNIEKTLKSENNEYRINNK